MEKKAKPIKWREEYYHGAIQDGQEILWAGTFGVIIDDQSHRFGEVIRLAFLLWPDGWSKFGRDQEFCAAPGKVEEVVNRMVSGSADTIAHPTPFIVDVERDIFRVFRYPSGSGFKHLFIAEGVLRLILNVYEEQSLSYYPTDDGEFIRVYANGEPVAYMDVANDIPNWLRAGRLDNELSPGGLMDIYEGGDDD